MSITEIAIKRPTLVIVIFTVLGVLGIFSYFQLKYELLPNITPPYATVVTIYPGASPKDVENSITKPVEDAVSSVNKIKSIESYSSEGVSMVFIEFQQDADEDMSVQDVQRKVNEILSAMPSGSKIPVISKFSLSDLPILRIGVTGNMPGREFYNFAVNSIKPRLTKLKGIGQVVLIGGEEREIKVNIDMNKMEMSGLSILQVMQIIKSSNFDFPAGKIKDTDGQYIVRIAGKFTSLEDLRNLILAKAPNGGTVKLRDIAEVEDGQKELSTISRLNGRESMGIMIQKQSGTNAVEISGLVREELKKMETDFSAQSIKFDIAQDSSDFTIEAAKSVGEDLVLAIILVGLVMLIFLHSIRSSLIVMVAIPASLITTLIGVYIFNFTLNLMTLLALSLVIGILVDDSIVVLENTYRHLEMGKDKRTAALDGRNEIGFSALSITLVDVVVFLPLALISGMIGKIVRQYSLVVVLSTMVSLFVSFTITPMLASRFGKIEDLTRKSPLGKFSAWFEKQFGKIIELYSRLIKWSLKNKIAVVIGTIVLFAGSVALVPAGFIGQEFVTGIDKGELSIQVELPERATIEDTNKVSRQIENILFNMPEIDKVFVNVGASSDGFMGQSSNNVSEINVALVPRNRRSKSINEVSEAIKKNASVISGIKVRVSPIGLFGTGDSFSIGITLTGDNFSNVYESAGKVENIMKHVKGVAEVKMTTTQGKPEMRVNINREKMALYGLTLDNVGGTLRAALSGDDESKYREGDNEYNIRILLDQFDRSSTGDIGMIKVTNLMGQQIELRQFADIVPDIGPNQLRRQDRSTSIAVLCQINGRPSGDVGADIQKGIKKETFPDGVTIREEGDTQMQSESFASLGFALMIAILFVYLIMVALYNSFVYPFVVLFSIPVAIVGALIALALTMKTLNIFSILGIIMLVGLVGKNAILLVDRANKNKENGLGIVESLVEAGKTRLRPIVMTSFAMILGMMPIALAFGGGAAEIKSSLGVALVGGLTSSMFLTLLLVPVVYMIFENIKNRFSARKNKQE